MQDNLIAEKIADIIDLRGICVLDCDANDCKCDREARRIRAVAANMLRSQARRILELEQRIVELQELGQQAANRADDAERASAETREFHSFDEIRDLSRQHMNALHQDAIEVKGKALESDSYLSADIAKLINESCICQDHLCNGCQHLLYAIGALEVRANRQFQSTRMPLLSDEADALIRRLRVEGMETARIEYDGMLLTIRPIIHDQPPLESRGFCGKHSWGAPPGEDELLCPYCIKEKQQQSPKTILNRLMDARLFWSIKCACNCDGCQEIDKVIRALLRQQSNTNE